MRNADERFLEKLSESLDGGTFVKLTLSEYTGEETGLRNLYARLVEVRGGRMLSLVFRYATRDITKNVPVPQAAEAVSEQLRNGFTRAHLFTTAGDWQLSSKRRGEASLKAQRPTFIVLPDAGHDRPKSASITTVDAGFLRALGVTNAAGEARVGMADKLRQIQRFVEVLGHLVDDSLLRDRRELRVLDMGAGKGYLTFATAEFFRSRGIAAEVIGIEQRPELVELTNRIARESGFPQLRFVQGAIGDTPQISPVDLLIALHACDTATDDALHQGIAADAALIIAAPCCHKEVRRQLAPPDVLRDVLKHGILCEREAELVTDGLRSFLLEIRGYKSTVFEFISPEHTSKNLMIAARRREHLIDPAPLRTRLHQLLSFYGIREQRLARLLGEL